MISVCVTTYNGEKFIARQLLSIAAQLREGDEIIVSDDGSTDGTLGAVSALQLPQVRIVKNEGEHGYTRNFENALRHARGEFIFLSDQDDLWLPGKVSECLAALQSAELVVTDAKIIDADDRETAPSVFALRRHYKSFLGNLFMFGYLGCCMCFRREILSRALPFPPDAALCTHDNWLFLVASCFFHTKIIEKPLLGYRRHGANASNGVFSAHRSPLFRVRYRLYLVRHLLSRGLRRAHRKK